MPDRDVEIQRVPGHHLAPEARPVDASEQREPVLVVLVGEGLQPPRAAPATPPSRHPVGQDCQEMARKELLIALQMPTSTRRGRRDQLVDLGEKKKRRPVWDKALDRDRRHSQMLPAGLGPQPEAGQVKPCSARSSASAAATGGSPATRVCRGSRRPSSTRVCRPPWARARQATSPRARTARRLRDGHRRFPPHRCPSWRRHLLCRRHRRLLCRLGCCSNISFAKLILSRRP